MGIDEISDLSVVIRIEEDSSLLPGGSPISRGLCKGGPNKK